MKARHLSSTELLAALQALDPLDTAEPLPAGDLHHRATEVMAAEHEPLMAISPAPLARATSLRWVLPVVTVLVVLLVVVLTQLNRSPRQSDPSSSAVAASSIPAAYRAIAEQTNPLSATMTVNCDGVDVAVPMLAAPGRAELGRSSSSADLRHFLAHNPFSGMGSVTNSNWLLLFRSHEKEVFGQREGRIGVGTVVTLTRRGGSFAASSLGGCGLVQPAARRSGQLIYRAAVTGTRLTLTWESGVCTPSTTTTAIVDRVLVRQVKRVVHVLLISKPTPSTVPSGQTCVGVGRSVETTITLTSPLGGRTLVDDSRVPGTVVTVKD